jgi:hypothetical protein
VHGAYITSVIFGQPDGPAHGVAGGLWLLRPRSQIPSRKLITERD